MQCTKLKNTRKEGEPLFALKKESRLDFPVEAITENFIFTTSDDVWVGYKLEHKEFPINNLEFFKHYIEDGEGLLENDQYEYHIADIPDYFDLGEHVDRTIHALVKGEFADLGEIYFKQAEEIIQDEVQMNHSTTYLFVKLTTVGQVFNPLEYVELIKDEGKKWLQKVTGQRIPRQVLLGTYRRMERQLYEDLLNYKMIERVSPKEIGRLYYYMFHRANQKMPTRQLTTEEITEGIVTNENGYLSVEQLDKTHYSCFFSIVDLPTSMFGSAFIQNLRDSLSFPVESHQRLRFDHEQSDLRKINKMRRRIYQQDQEQLNVDGVLDDDEVILFGEERLKELANNLKSKDKRLCKAMITLVVSANSKEQLEERVKDVEFVLDGTDYKIYRSIVDQLTLFNHCLIGSKSTFRSFEQIVTTGYLADLGVDLEKEVGNLYGFPLGRIITAKKYKSVKQALQLSSKLVWFFPNLTKKNVEGATHKNGNTLIIGPPGQGKSVLVKYIFLWLTFLGQKILYVDPKNETELFFQKALKQFGYIPEFKELIGRINFISLSDKESCRGMLDPLLFLPREEAIQTARNVLNAFGEVDSDSTTASSKKTTILDAVETVMRSGGKRHLTKVIDEIRKTDPQLAKLISGYNVGLGKILIGNDYSNAIKFENQINVLGTQGLKLPSQKDIESGRMNSEQIAGMSIMEVIMKLTNIFSTNKEEDAAIIFDEAKGFEDTAQGSYLIEDSQRKGRANNTDIYVVTQAFMDYDREDKKELISYKFAFRPNQKKAQEKVLEFFGMEPNSANKQMIDNLRSGTCLFQDHKGRNQPIAIDVLFDSWLMAISSTDDQDESTQLALEMEKNK